MVITVFWMHSWTVPIISVSVLFIAVMFLLCCFCLQRKQSDHLKIGKSNRKNFLMISDTSLNKLMIFRHYDPRHNEATLPSFQEEEVRGFESDLVETEDVSQRFTSSRLRIDALDEEDMRSCASADSRFTFYSTYPGLPRSASTISDSTTYKSARNSLKTLPVTHRSTSNLFVSQTE